MLNYSTFSMKKSLKKKPTKNRVSEYLKYRPSEEEMEEFKIFCIQYWDSFKSKLSFISEYLNLNVNAAVPYRNNETGGNLLFRPIGLLPFLKASLIIHKREEKTFNEIFERFNNINYAIDTKPWQYVVWNPIENKMIMNASSLTYLLLIYLYDSELLQANELQKLKEGYASKISYEQNLDDVLNEI